MGEYGRVDVGQVAVLAAVFAQVTDPRQPRGVRHQLSAVLTLITLALLCGSRNFRQASDRIAEMPQALLAAAGARRHPSLGVRVPPGRDTLRRLAALVDAELLDLLIGVWLTDRLTEQIRAAGPVMTGRIGLAIDGKTVRNSSARPRTGTEVQLFSALRHDNAVVVAQVRVPAGTTEVTQVEALLDPVDITGMVVTADAAHPSKATAAYLTGRHADYIFTVKNNRPPLLEAITNRLTRAAVTGAHTCTERRHGHRITRTIQTAPAAGITMPAAAQIFRLHRRVTGPDGRLLSEHVVHGITSLTSPAAQIAAHVRTHWWIENKSHWIRDVLLGEDDHRAYLGDIAHTMAALRNLAIALIRLAGHTRVKQVMESHHGNKMLIPQLLNASKT